VSRIGSPAVMTKRRGLLGNPVAGRRRSLRKIAEELADAGHLNKSLGAHTML
jgi:hypothetical protein